MKSLADLNTQQRRVYQAALSFRGITQIDFDPPTVDGGEPIKRVAARVEELETDFGLVVDRIGRRNKCVIYRLAADHHAPVKHAPRDVAGPSRWFCYATRECMTAGPLDGPSCPRGAHHDTHTEIYVDLVGDREARAEELAA